MEGQGTNRRRMPRGRQEAGAKVYEYHVPFCESRGELARIHLEILVILLDNALVLVGVDCGRRAQ